MKPRGRPPIDAEDPSVNVQFRVPGKQFDAAQRQAEQERLTLAQWIRRLVRDATAPPFRNDK